MSLSLLSLPRLKPLRRDLVKGQRFYMTVV